MPALAYHQQHLQHDLRRRITATPLLLIPIWLTR